MTRTADEVVEHFLANTTDPAVVEALVAADATYERVARRQRPRPPASPALGRHLDRAGHVRPHLRGGGPLAAGRLHGARHRCRRRPRGGLRALHLPLEDAGEDRHLAVLHPGQGRCREDHVLPVHGGHLRDVDDPGRPRWCPPRGSAQRRTPDSAVRPAAPLPPLAIARSEPVCRVRPRRCAAVNAIGDAPRTGHHEEGAERLRPAASPATSSRASWSSRGCADGPGHLDASAPYVGN